MANILDEFKPQGIVGADPLDEFKPQGTTTTNLLDEFKPTRIISPTINTNPLDEFKPQGTQSTVATPRPFIQKAFDFTLGEGLSTGEFDKMTKLGQTLDLMGRPGYAVKSGMYEAALEVNQYLRDNGIPEEELHNPLNLERQKLLLDYKPKVEERFKKVWAGLTGHERVTANQMWAEMGVSGIPLLGFATEVVLDPLMAFGGAGYKTLGAIVKAGAIRPAAKVAGFLGKQLYKIDQVANAADFAVDAGGAITAKLRELFITKSKIPELAAMVDKHLSRRQWLGGKGVDFAVITRNEIQKDMKETGKSAKDVMKMVVNVMELPKKYKKLATPREIAIAQSQSNMYSRIFTNMTDAGVPINALNAARKARITELYTELETAVGKKQTELLGEIAAHQDAIADDIVRFKEQLQPLSVNVAHYSKNPNITEWKINKKTVKGDLGTDFGTEKAALARQQDIGKGGEGKVYYTQLSPKRSIDATKIPMEEQCQNWDRPKDVVEFIHKTGAIGPDEYEQLKNAIPDPQDIKYKQVPKAPATKITTKLIAQPKNDEGMILQVQASLKRQLTPEEMELIPEVLQGKSVDIENIRISYNPKIKKYNIHKTEGTTTTYYHGSTEDAIKKIKDMGFDVEKSQYSDDFKGMYAASDEGFAELMGMMQTEGEPGYGTLKIQIPTGTKLYQLSDKPSANLEGHPDFEILRGEAKQAGFTGKYSIQKYLKKQGYEGIQHKAGDELVIFNPNKFLGKIEQPETGKFIYKKWSDDVDDWYVDFSQKLRNKGYDTVKYFSLEDTTTPTYKVLTSRIIGPPSKAAVATQEKLATMITAKEAEVTNLVNEAKEIYHMQVSEKRIATVANKLGVGKAEAKEIAQLQRAREMGYFPRFTTKEAEGFLKNAEKNRGMGARVWNKKIRNALRRKTSDFTLDEWNNFVTENGLEALGGNKIDEYFMRDPAYASALYQIRAAKAITSAEFVQDVTKTFGKSAKEALPSWIELPEAIQKLYPAAKGLKFDPEVVAEVARVAEYYIDPKAVDSVLKYIDMYRNMWRKWQLYPFSKYHLRNMVGNMWNNYLADVDGENYLRAQALQLYRKYKGKGNIGEKIATFELKQMQISPEVADTIIASAEEHGVFNLGQYGADVETGIRRKMGEFTLGETLRGERIIEKGKAIGNTIENNAHLAHFMDKMSKGMDSAEAALSAKKYLFDYSDITAFERGTMRRLCPFYTWSRKNIPLQMEALWNNPEKFAPLAIPFRMRDEEDLVRLKYVRPDLYERLPIEFKRTVDAVTYVPLEGLIPAGDLAKLIPGEGELPWEGLTDTLFEMLTPEISYAIERKMNKSFYFESEIKKYDGETQELLRLPLPVEVKHFITRVAPWSRLLNEIDKIVKKQTKKIELTPAEQAFSQSLSSVYKIDLKELRDRALMTMKKEAEELKKGAVSAHIKDRPDEVERIKKTYEKIKLEIKRIKGN